MAGLKDAVRSGLAFHQSFGPVLERIGDDFLAYILNSDFFILIA